VLAAIDNPQPEDATRDFGITGAMAVAGFIVECVSVLHQIWAANRDHALLIQALNDSEKLNIIFPTLDPEKRLGLVARVVRTFLPDLFAAPSQTRSAASMAEKQRWIADYIEHRRKEAGSAPTAVATRDFVGGVTILVPFAEQMNWIVWKDIGWMPDTSDGPDVVRVDVERGFVTDLASIPSYLAPILRKSGKFSNAAIYHDWLYWRQAEAGSTREVADRVFDRAMNDMGVDAVTRNLIWAGVRVFGGDAWEENAKEKASGGKRILKKFPDAPDITWEDWRQRPDVFV